MSIVRWFLGFYHEKTEIQGVKKLLLEFFSNKEIFITSTVSTGANLKDKT